MADKPILTEADVQTLTQSLDAWAEKPGVDNVVEELTSTILMVMLGKRPTLAEHQENLEALRARASSAQEAVLARRKIVQPLRDKLTKARDQFEIDRLIS